MPGRRRSPRARDRAIGAQLRALRAERARISLERAADLAGWSPATLSRTENGKRHITSEDVASLLTVYRIPVAERETLIEAARSTGSAGWWSAAGTTALAGYEATASVLTTWAAGLVPALLQTRAYAIGFMAADGAGPREAEARWAARHRRQAILPKLDYTAYLHEAVLHTPFGGRAALAEQLTHLLDVGARGVGVRVVRHQPHAALVHSWLLLEFPSSPPIVHVELQRSTVDLHDDEAVAYLRLRKALDRIALPAAESRDTIRELLRRV